MALARVRELELLMTQAAEEAERKLELLAHQNEVCCILCILAFMYCERGLNKYFCAHPRVFASIMCACITSTMPSHGHSIISYLSYIHMLRLCAVRMQLFKKPDI